MADSDMGISEDCQNFNTHESINMTREKNKKQKTTRVFLAVGKDKGCEEVQSLVEKHFSFLTEYSLTVVGSLAIINLYTNRNVKMTVCAFTRIYMHQFIHMPSTAHTRL